MFVKDFSKLKLIFYIQKKVWMLVLKWILVLQTIYMLVIVGFIITTFWDNF